VQRSPTLHLVLVSLVLAVSGCPAARMNLQGAEAQLHAGAFKRALAEYDAIAAHPAATPAERVQALTGAALACDKLGDTIGARERLERAIVPEVPGASEPAMYYLADHLRATDRGRALNLYYRAAAGSEKHRHGGFPYRAAMDRIVQLSMSR
jgi:hypothetical protein